MRHCAALFVAAPASGQGKTTVPAALARRYRDQGRQVRVFKAGPDFIDPMILERASDAPVYQLDLWLCGADQCRHLLYQAAGEADLILIEGVMGLFDGDPSSADLALLFGIPVLTVIDASAMAQTFGAVAHGLANFRPALPFAGVFANRTAGEMHYHMLTERLPPGLTAVGGLANQPNITLPDRHLGLVQAHEIKDLDARVAAAAASLYGLDGTAAPVVNFAPAATTTGRATSLNGIRVAIAHDAAFGFVYRANLDLLRGLGAQLDFFSPLADRALPEADALYLPGGYPELHLERLAGNATMQAAIRAHHAAGKAVFAECGGMLYLLESLTDSAGRQAPMVGLLPGKAVTQPRLTNLGLHIAPLPAGDLRGHTFHHSQLDCHLEPTTYSRAARYHGKPEPIYRVGELTASYLHLYFPSNPEAAARLFLKES